MNTRHRVVNRRTLLAALVVFALAALASSTTIGQTIANPAIAFISSSTSTGTWLSVMNADGSNMTKLFGGKSGEPAEPNWSPDGQWITFELVHSINVISKNGGTPALLVDAPAPSNAFNPVWSPLGDRIAYEWKADTTIAVGADLRAIPTGGGPAQVLYRFQYPLDLLGGLSWSPDATRLTVEIYDSSLTTTRKSNLSIFDTVTGAIQDVTHPLGFDWVDGYHADWARHSNHIAFCGALVGQASALWILDLDLMQATKLVDGISFGSPSWSPDDSRIVFTKNSELWTVNVATGVQTILAKKSKQQTGLRQANWRRF